MVRQKIMTATPNECDRHPPLIKQTQLLPPPCLSLTEPLNHVIPALVASKDQLRLHGLI